MVKKVFIVQIVCVGICWKVEITWSEYSDIMKSIRCLSVPGQCLDASDSLLYYRRLSCGKCNLRIIRASNDFPFPFNSYLESWHSNMFNIVERILSHSVSELITHNRYHAKVFTTLIIIIIIIINVRYIDVNCKSNEKPLPNRWCVSLSKMKFIL